MSLSPEMASEKYVELEQEYNRLSQLIKDNSRHSRAINQWRRQKNKIRAEQNALFAIFKGTPYVMIASEDLGFNPYRQTLYKRYTRSLK